MDFVQEYPRCKTCEAWKNGQTHPEYDCKPMDGIYVRLMIKYYSPRHYMIRAHRLLGRLAKRMSQNGYTDAQIITLANKARFHHGLSELGK